MTGRVLAKTLLVMVVFLFVISCQTEKSFSQVSVKQPAEELLIVGHRCAAGLAPENTLAAFGKACELGVDAVELDVYLAADSTLVVHHDYTLKPETTRTADGEWLSHSGPAIKDLTLAQLITYDIDDFNGSIPRAVKAAGGKNWAPYYKYLTSALLDEAHQLGLEVYVWTVDSRSEMVRLIEMGVDGIITNRPDILKSVVGLP